jgi:hypothetical protein
MIAQHDYTCGKKKPRTNCAQAFRDYAQKNESAVAFLQVV